MSEKLPRFANQYTKHSLGDKPLKCDVTDNKVLQDFVNDTDINYIVQQYAQGEKLPVIRKDIFGDETIIPKTYEEMKSFTDKVEQDFLTLPANIKKEFGNNPQTYADEFMKVFTDKKISDKFSKLGIFNSKSAELYPASADPSFLTSGGDSKSDTQSQNVSNSANSSGKESGQNGSN